MPTQSESTALVVQDGYDAYYTEKLWSWLPGFYHTQDANTSSPGTLRAVIESLGSQSAELRRSLDRIWENAFVELADDGALELLGELVATRMVSQLNRRGRRLGVARAIHYRRRKGTPRLLETLVSDMGGWAGAHLETRQRLARTYHLLEPAPDRNRVVFTQTPRGGWANLRHQRIPTLAWTAFEELAHTPDFRRQAGNRGRYGIAKVNVHLHRMQAYAIDFPTIVQIGSNPTQFALDPSGRAVPLFQPSTRPGAESWTRVREWQVAKSLECRLLAHSEFEWTAAELAATSLDPADIAALSKYAGYRMHSVLELRFLANKLGLVNLTTSAATMVELMQATMIDACGRRQLYGDGLALNLAIGSDNENYTEIEREEIQVGKLASWGASWNLAVIFDADRPDHELVIDPARGAVLSQSTDGISSLLLAPKLHYGFPGVVGAGSYDRRASIETGDDVNTIVSGASVGRIGPVGLDPAQHSVEEFADNKTYTLDADLADIEDYRLQAANFKRPYLLYTEAAETPVWTFSAHAAAEAACLVFEGLWIGTEDTTAGELSPPAAPSEGILRLSGDWDRVEINHCTLDPGGEQMSYEDGGTQTRAIQYVTLEIAGFVNELVIDRSIVGPIIGTNGALDGCSVGKLTIRDSIVMGNSDQDYSIDVELGDLHVERSTIVGDVKANRLYASDSLFTGVGTITDRQNGCFRFSAGVEGNWPRPFEHYFFSTFDGAWLESQTFGDPGLVRLTEIAPAAIRTGAENHCEMGVWNHLFEVVKRNDLRAKINELMPFDLNMQLVTED